MRRIRRFKSIAALALLGVILSYTLVKTFHHHEERIVYQFGVTISQHDESVPVNICSYLLSPFTYDDSSSYSFDSCVMAYLLFPAIRDKEEVAGNYISLRAPPAC